MIFSEILQLGVELSKLGASPAVQQVVLSFLAKQAGVSQGVLTAAITAAVLETLPAPKLPPPGV